MKKTIIMKALLILFPVLAVGLASTVDSVTVFDTLTGQTEYYSYFDALPVANLRYVPFMAALVSALSGVLTVIYIATKRNSLLKTVSYTALAGTFLATIPMLIREEILVIPNVALPIFMVLQYIVAYMLEKQTPETSQKIRTAKPKKK